MLTSQIVIGILNAIFGLIIMKFPYFFSKIIFIKAPPIHFRSAEKTFGEERGAKFIFYFGLLILIIGLIVLLTGLLNINIFG